MTDTQNPSYRAYSHAELGVAGRHTSCQILRSWWPPAHLGEGQVGKLGESARALTQVTKSFSLLLIQGLKPLLPRSPSFCNSTLTWRLRTTCFVSLSPLLVSFKNNQAEFKLFGLSVPAALGESGWRRGWNVVRGSGAGRRGL